MSTSLRRSFTVWALAAAALTLPAFAGSECAGHATEAQAAPVAKQEGCCAQACAQADCPHRAEAARLASAAAGGCQASKEKLIAMAKESGNEEAVALAVKAEAGSQESADALVALAMTYGAAPPSMAALAARAEHGCAKSASELIQLAKSSQDAEIASLAKAAEGGCEQSRAALIARAKTLDPGAQSSN